MKSIDNYSVIGIQSDYDDSCRIFHVFRESPFKMIGYVRLECTSDEDHEISQQLIAEAVGIGFIKT